MIERYTLPEMGRVWSEAHKYELWCRVETLVLEAHADAGTVPADAVACASRTRISTRHHSAYLCASLQIRPILGRV